MATDTKGDLIRKQLLVLEEMMANDEDGRRIEYFGIESDEISKRHWERGCCKIGKGMNPMQKKLIEAWGELKYKVFVFAGSNRIGKTTIGAIISICFIAGKWLWSGEDIVFKHKRPRKIRYVGQDWEKHIKEVVEPTLKFWWPANRPYTTKKNNQGIESLWTDTLTGSTIEIMSNNQESKLHEGWEGDLIIYDEPPKRDIRVANARGLVDREGRELFCMTLLSEAWVDREVIKARNEDGTPDMSVFNVNGTIYDNIGYGLTKEGVDQFAKTLTDDEKQARLHGKPSYLTGLVYPQFDRHIHLKKRFKIPLDWIVDIAIDIHPREKQAVVFIATDQRNYRYVCFEIWEHGDGTAIAEEIIRICKTYALRVGEILIDPLSKGDSNVDKTEVADILEGTTYNKVENVLNRYGLPLRAAEKSKTSGILEVRNHLMGPNQESSIFFFDDLKRTVWEIEGYMYDDESQKPVDKDDHMMENLYRLLLINTQWYPMNFKGSGSTETNWKLA